MDTNEVKKQFILCLFLCCSAEWLSGCDKPVCTGQDLQGQIYGQSWTLRSGMAVRGRNGYVITLSGEEPDGNPCSFSSYTTGSHSLQITVPAFPGAHPLNDFLDATQVSFCAADALVCDIATSGEVRIDSADRCEGTLSGRIQAYLDETSFVDGCFAIRRCSILEWLKAELGAEGSGDLTLVEQAQGWQK
ncbi:MAG: hypothetical protein JW832_09740 [Deltaproteobacteria bacterium]|nr:hypothetical protein [Deltaproteobacteria bacterium]